MLLGAIADDLTGATDLALILAREGMKVIQIVGVPQPDQDFGDADAIVVSLKSRTIAPQAAVEQSLAAARVLLGAGAEQIYFKYCSTFDSTEQGNIGPVTEALMSDLGVEHTVACPAFPENKRTVYKGHLFVGDQLLSESPMKDHPLTPMRDANLVRVLQKQTKQPVRLVNLETVHRGVDALRDSLMAEPGIVILDAITDHDLRVIGEAMADLKLITGGSALAQGLPDNYRRQGKMPAEARKAEFNPPKGNGIMLAGSCSAATRRQIANAQAAGVPSFKLDALEIAEGKLTVDDVLAFIEAQANGNYPALIYSSTEPEQVRIAQDKLGRFEAGEMVENFLSTLAVKLAEQGYQRFIVAGGETSGAVVNALNAETVQIGPEIDPGVPWVFTLDEANPVCLALKSGNFGSDDFFTKAWDMVR